MQQKDVDFPPVWLAAFAAAGGIVGRVIPYDLPWADLLGPALVVLGLLLMAIAVAQMLIARTTIIPRRDADCLITGGIFRLSRNPIYLGDALLLAGLYIYWHATLALPLVIAFAWTIQRRFIEGEEERLAAIYGEIYEAYRMRTRRWI